MRVEIPFLFHAYGARGKRVPQVWQVLSHVDADVPEIRSTEADAVLSMRWDGGVFPVTVVDGATYVPMVFPDEGFRIGTWDDYRTLAATIRTGFPKYEPLGRPILDARWHPVRNSEPVTYGSISASIPSDEDERRDLNEELGRFMLSIDGVPHSSRWEPCLAPGRNGAQWGLADLSDGARKEHPKTARPGFLRHDERVDPGQDRVLTGDVDAVRWRYDNGPALVAAAVTVLQPFCDAEWSHFPTNRVVAPALFRRLQRHAADFGLGLPIDVEAASREIAEALDFAERWLSPDSGNRHLPDFSRQYLDALETNARALASAPIPYEDMDAVSAMTF